MNNNDTSDQSRVFWSDRLWVLPLRQQTPSRPHRRRRPKHGAGKVHRLLHRPGRLPGRGRPPAAPHRHLRSAALLGFLRPVRAAAHLPQPGSVDILVPGEPHRL